MKFYLEESREIRKGEKLNCIQVVFSREDRMTVK
jgi:hypothetical protein